MRASAMPLMFSPSISPRRSGGAGREISAGGCGAEIDVPMQTRPKPRIATGQVGDSPWVTRPRPIRQSPPISVGGLAEAAHQPPGEPALADRAQEADAHERQADLFRAPAEAVLGP